MLVVKFSQCGGASSSFPRFCSPKAVPMLFFLPFALLVPILSCLNWFFFLRFCLEKMIQNFRVSHFLFSYCFTSSESCFLVFFLGNFEFRYYFLNVSDFWGF
uniref:(northern house mosquito) hypothetical protein n=1 Tax=Culex pipiens TaxID=7175 RepID=A0A8D8EVG8_CULPI